MSDVFWSFSDFRRIHFLSLQVMGWFHLSLLRDGGGKRRRGFYRGTVEASI